MPQYKLCFIATERTEYSITINADTPEEAFKKFNNPEYNRGDYEEECFLGLIEKENEVQIEGEYIENKYMKNISSLKRYDKPIKLKIK